MLSRCRSRKRSQTERERMEKRREKEEHTRSSLLVSDRRPLLAFPLTLTLNFDAPTQNRSNQQNQQTTAPSSPSQGTATSSSRPRPASRPGTPSSPARPRRSVACPKGVLVANAGFAGDGVTLQKVLKSRAVAYQHAHRRPMPVHAAAQLLGNTLYYKRFFPYYAFCLCAGLDDEEREPSTPTMPWDPTRGSGSRARAPGRI